MVDSEHRLGVRSEPVRYRVFRIGLALSVVVFILTLTPLAYADPPDPTWQLGFFDDDDFDDVVGLITMGTNQIAFQGAQHGRVPPPVDASTPAPEESPY